VLLAIERRLIEQFRRQDASQRHSCRDDDHERAKLLAKRWRHGVVSVLKSEIRNPKSERRQETFNPEDALACPLFFPISDVGFGIADFGFGWVSVRSAIE